MAVKKLNFGCGRDIREGYVNADIARLDGVDKVFDFNKFPYPISGFLIILNMVKDEGAVIMVKYSDVAVT